MTQYPAAINTNRGFTLLETIIYIGLFGIIFSGIFVSIYPLFTGAERLTRNIVIEGETAFILAKIHYAFAHTITSPDATVSVPSPDRLILLDKDGNEVSEFTTTVGEFCSPPLQCKMLILELGNDSDKRFPLNAQRVEITDFVVSHTAATRDVPGFVDLEFKANGVNVGPVRYYLHF